jgi:[ribosomal protein S18]-alanine N-acetyltransferase
MTSLNRVTLENQEFYLDRILEIETLSFSAPWSLVGFLQELENPFSHLWALVFEGVILGYLCFWTVRKEMQLLDLAVHPKYRGQGNGGFLLAKMIDHAASQGISSIWLEVRVSGSAARKLYEKFGFVESGRRKDYYTDPREDAVIMSLALPVADGKTIFTDERIGDSA